jgi:predicted permease
MRTRVVAQLALAVVVVFAAALLGRTLINFMQIDPGFSIDRIVSVSFDPIDSGYTAEEMPALGRRLVETVSSVPGILSASVSRCGLIAGCTSSGSYMIEGIDDPATLYQNWVSPGYFANVGIPLVAGREFDDRDRQNGQPVTIVNESIARRWFPGVNPVGRRLGPSRPDMEIVGVVRDARTQSLHDAPVPMAYFPVTQTTGLIRQSSLTNLDVRVSGGAGPSLGALRDAIRRSEPRLLIGDLVPKATHLRRDLSRERVVAYLSLSFGALALILASLGLYGVLSYGVARRTQEIGVRMALGARRAEVMRLVLGESMRMTAAGLGLGLAGAIVCSRYLSGMLFGVAPLDPAAFGAVVLALAVVTTLASYIPAHRATTVDPLVALRSE